MAEGEACRTYDLVVLGAEWGHGRREGWLSNLHLGARDPATGGFVMVGKCFKGLTDGLLEWQTRELLGRETDRRGIAVLARPELVVEIALDGVQSSTRYKGGVALRFARVKRYRPDKPAEEADTIEDVFEPYLLQQGLVKRTPPRPGPDGEGVRAPRTAGPGGNGEPVLGGPVGLIGWLALCQACRTSSVRTVGTGS